MRGDRSERAGFALVTALMVMLCLAGLLAGLAFTAREDHALSVATRDSRRAFAAAELAAWSAMNALDSAHLGLHVGGEIGVPVFAGADTVHGALRRLGEGTFLALGTAGVRAPGGEWLIRRSALLFTATRDSAGAVTTTPGPGHHWFQP
jgi:hypothetical protein